MAIVTLTIPGDAVPAPPGGEAWQFIRRYRDGRTTLASLPVPPGQTDPTPPAGHRWRVITRNRHRIHIAEADPFLYAASENHVWDAMAWHAQQRARQLP